MFKDVRNRSPLVYWGNFFRKCQKIKQSVFKGHELKLLSRALEKRAVCDNTDLICYEVLAYFPLKRLLSICRTNRALYKKLKSHGLFSKLIDKNSVYTQYFFPFEKEYIGQLSLKDLESIYGHLKLKEGREGTFVPYLKLQALLLKCRPELFFGEFGEMCSLSEQAKAIQWVQSLNAHILEQLVWVRDSQLFTLGREMKSRYAEARISFYIKFTDKGEAFIPEITKRQKEKRYTFFIEGVGCPEAMGRNNHELCLLPLVSPSEKIKRAYEIFYRKRGHDMRYILRYKKGKEISLYLGQDVEKDHFLDLFAHSKDILRLNPHKKVLFGNDDKIVRIIRGY